MCSKNINNAHVGRFNVLTILTVSHRIKSQLSIFFVCMSQPSAMRNWSSSSASSSGSGVVGGFSCGLILFYLLCLYLWKG